MKILKKMSILGAILVLLVTGVFGCSKQEIKTNEIDKIGVILNGSPGVLNSSDYYKFNDLLEITDSMKASLIYNDNVTDDSISYVLTSYGKNEYDVVIIFNKDYERIAREVGNTYKETKYVIVDGSSDNTVDNVFSATLKEDFKYELSGFAASSMYKKSNIYYSKNRERDEAIESFKKGAKNNEGAVVSVVSLSKYDYSTWYNIIQEKIYSKSTLELNSELVENTKPEIPVEEPNVTVGNNVISGQFKDGSLQDMALKNGISIVNVDNLREQDGDSNALSVYIDYKVLYNQIFNNINKDGSIISNHVKVDPNKTFFITNNKFVSNKKFTEYVDANY